MKRSKNPFPGGTRTVDRHGKVRWRFRGKGKTCYIRGEYGSSDFRRSYEAAVYGASYKNVEGPKSGSMKWICDRYKQSLQYRELASSTRKVLARELDWLMDIAGDLPMASLETSHVEALMMKKTGPAAGNIVRKNISRLFSFALKAKLINTPSPTRLASGRKENADGFYTWTDHDIYVFRQKHRSGTSARMALELALNTGAARQDLAQLGWKNIKGNFISYKRGKTGVSAVLPILAELQNELNLARRDQLLFVSHTGGKAYKATTLGNWFKDRTVESGLTTPGANIHGLRKAGATRLAEVGATELEIASFLAHENTKQASIYTKKANRALLSASGMAKLPGSKVDTDLSNPNAWLDNDINNIEE